MYEVYLGGLSKLLFALLKERRNACRVGVLAPGLDIFFSYLYLNFPSTCLYLYLFVPVLALYLFVPVFALYL